MAEGDTGMSLSLARLGQAALATGSPPGRFKFDRDVKSSTPEAREWTALMPARPSVSTWSRPSARLESTALGVRWADTAVERVGLFLDQMQSELEVIAKNFPPFSPRERRKKRAPEKPHRPPQANRSVDSSSRQPGRRRDSREFRCRICTVCA